MVRSPFRPALLALLLLQGACQSPENAPISAIAPLPPNSLGGALSSDAPANRLSPALSPRERLTHSLGASFFNKPWVSAPSTTHDRDGLGPLFNAHSCSACHPRAGRGMPFEHSSTESSGLLFRLTEPDPVFGAQLQTRALPGFRAEGQVSLQYSEQTVSLNDGDIIRLRRPRYQAHQRLSPRLAPRLIGLGLIDAIPQRAIAAGADPDDRDGDGISGQVAGRFGWKAEQESLKGQVAKAFVEDLGISTSLFPVSPGCEQNPLRCKAVSGGTPELSDSGLEAVVDYLSHLSVPRVRLSETHAEGWRLFQKAGCAACHQAQWQTGKHNSPVLAEQTIYPFSDFLLHDLGPALADSNGAMAGEWRTAPLWALGDGPYLHDGRARTLLEAIFWHGGEASSSVSRVQRFSGSERAALVEFLHAL